MKKPLCPAAALCAGLSAPLSEYYKIGNGLEVVLSRDATSPKAVVAVFGKASL